MIYGLIILILVCPRPNRKTQKQLFTRSCASCERSRKIQGVPEIRTSKPSNYIFPSGGLVGILVLRRAMRVTKHLKVTDLVGCSVMERVSQ